MANFTEQNLTAEVLRTFANTPNKRLKFIIEETVKSLHDLVRRTDLNFEEWNQAIDFLTRTGQICTPLRQEFILLSDVLGVSMLVDAVNHREREGATETTVLGPFYVGEHRVTPHGADISKGVDGEPMFVQSRVIDLAGRPLAGAEIDVWHADDDGFYDSQKPDYAGHGPSLRARFIADADGRFSFRTILPCSYPIPTDGPVGNLIASTKRHPMRPAHVHFLVKAEGYEPLITHVFLDGDEYLRSDVVFGVKDELIARVEPKGEPVLPNGEQVSGRWHLMSYDFQMKPGAGLVPQPMIASEQHGGTMATPTRIAPIGEAPAATICPGVRIGHVHLKVADIDRALAFYCGVLGFELMQQIGPQAAFVSAGGYHHHIGLNTWESRGGAPPAPGTTGLHHLAVLYPTRAELVAALRRLIEADIPLDGASDHGVSEALYLRDPDDNGVELYWDRPKELWPLTADGKLAMFTRRLDLMNLLAEADTAPGAPVDAPLFEPSRGA